MNNLQQAKEFRILCKCVLTENQKTVMFNAIKALKSKIEYEFETSKHTCICLSSHRDMINYKCNGCKYLNNCQEAIKICEEILK